MTSTEPTVPIEEKPAEEKPKKRSKPQKKEGEPSEDKPKGEPKKSKVQRKRRPYKKLEQDKLEGRIEKLSSRIDRYKKQTDSDSSLLVKYLYEKQCRAEDEPEPAQSE